MEKWCHNPSEDPLAANPSVNPLGLEFCSHQWNHSVFGSKCKCREPLISLWGLVYELTKHMDTTVNIFIALLKRQTKGFISLT